MISNDTKKTSKNIAIFACDLCDFECSKKSDWNRHVTRPKHLKHTEMIQNDTNKNIKNATLDHFVCECGNTYKHHSGLWRHKKTCNIIELDEENIILKNEPKDDPKDKQFDLIMLLVKENSEFKNMMLEVLKNGITNNNTNISNTNSHNKAFNLNFFLNETCKNAMNITEFADSIKLQLSDFENVGDVGFITGISNIIIKNLKALDITQRPLHCTDQKRETIYIKDEDKWEKEDDKKQKCHKFIKKIVNKNQRLLLKFQEVYPDYNKYSSPNSTRYDLIVIEALGGRGDNTAEKEDKILSNISKTICVNKDTL
jgi:hypothetical protein